MLEENKKYDLFLFAGEESGDNLGFDLIYQLQKLRKEISIFGVFGKKMREFGFDAMDNAENFEIMGFLDILFYLPKLIRKFFHIRKIILKKNPKACVFIDYPGFTLKLEKSLRKKGYKGKLIHYVCPTVWAYKKNRIKTMEKTLDLLLVTFPFEKKHFEKTKLKTFYVGNPIFSKILSHPPFKKTPSKNQIGIFPGSRKKEIERNLPIQLNALFKVFKDLKNFKIFISLSNEKFKKLINKILKKYPEIFKKNIFVSPSSKNYHLMEKLDFSIATSGTINLELALFKVPTIVTYMIKPFDLFIARNIFRINLPFYCIVNILAKKLIFKELYGPNLSEENLVFWINKFLLEKETKKNITLKCNDIENILQKKEASKNAALHIIESLR